MDRKRNNSQVIYGLAISLLVGLTACGGDEMAARWQQGYKPIQTAETSALDPLSVRYMRHMEDNVNSSFVAMSPKLVSQVWPGGKEADLATSVWVHGTWGPFFVSPHYDVISWTASVYSEVAVAVDWTIVTHDTMIYDALYSRAGERDTIRTSDTDIITGKRSCAISRNQATRETWIYVISTSNTESVSIPPTIYTLDVTAEISEAY